MFREGRTWQSREWSGAGRERESGGIPQSKKESDCSWEEGGRWIDKQKPGTSVKAGKREATETGEKESRK